VANDGKEADDRTRTRTRTRLKKRKKGTEGAGVILINKISVEK
jgi:hypothetical protein